MAVEHALLARPPEATATHINDLLNSAGWAHIRDAVRESLLRAQGSAEIRSRVCDRTRDIVEYHICCDPKLRGEPELRIAAICLAVLQEAVGLFDTIFCSNAAFEELESKVREAVSAHCESGRFKRFTRFAGSHRCERLIGCVASVLDQCRNSEELFEDLVSRTTERLWRWNPRALLPTTRVYFAAITGTVFWIAKDEFRRQHAKKNTDNLIPQSLDDLRISDLAQRVVSPADELSSLEDLQRRISAMPGYLIQTKQCLARHLNQCSNLPKDRNDQKSAKALAAKELGISLRTLEARIHSYLKRLLPPLP